MGKKKGKKSKKSKKSSDEEDEDQEEFEGMSPPHLPNVGQHQGRLPQQAHMIQEADEQDAYFDDDQEEDDNDFGNPNPANRFGMKDRVSVVAPGDSRSHFFPTLEEATEKQFMDQLEDLQATFGHQTQHNHNPSFPLHMPPSLMLQGIPMTMQFQHGAHTLPPPLHHPQQLQSLINMQIPPPLPHPILATAQDDPLHPSDVSVEDHKFNVITNEGSDKSNKMILVSTVNLFHKTFGGRINTIPALSKPYFCPERNELFICGTEEQDPIKKLNNHLIFGVVDEHNNIIPRLTWQLNDHVRDVQWLDSQHIVFAANQRLGLVRMSTTELGIEDVVMFPEFHKDAIREICVSEGNKNLVISGGFDGNVFVTDISRLCSDIQKNEKKSENSLYPCRDVVGSVNWHPHDTFLASCTTDTGTLHIFDIRTDKRRPAIVYDTLKRELFTHSYKDDTTILMGYGDGQILVFDTRSKRSMMGFQDPHQKQIGEIRFDYRVRAFAVFGSPEFTLWNYDESSVQLIGHQMLADEHVGYKTSGEFRRGTGMFAVTDSVGNLALYAIPTELR